MGLAGAGLWAYRALPGAGEDVQEGPPRAVLGHHAGRLRAGAQEHDDVGVAQHAHQLRLLAQLVQHTAALGRPAVGTRTCKPHATDI